MHLGFKHTTSHFSRTFHDHENIMTTDGCTINRLFPTIREIIFWSTKIHPKIHSTKETTSVMQLKEFGRWSREKTSPKQFYPCTARRVKPWNPWIVCMFWGNQLKRKAVVDLFRGYIHSIRVFWGSFDEFFISQTQLILLFPCEAYRLGVRYAAACGVLSMRNVACHPRPIVTWLAGSFGILLPCSSPLSVLSSIFILPLAALFVVSFRWSDAYRSLVN